MAISWNEIKDRALNFSKEWKDESRERAEKDTFWNEFFHVFDISRRRVATFEAPVKKLNNAQGFIDLFWKGTLLVEHKSKGKNLDAAFEQATDYFYGLEEYELPKYVLVSDFERFRLYDLDENQVHEFHINDFHKNVKLFGFIAGYLKQVFKDEDPVNIKAAELMGKLHDQLKESGYIGHPLEVYLVRLLFALFADDTGIFEKDTFKEFIEVKTNKDGSDLGGWFAQFFQALNTPTNERQKNLDEHINAFPFVNGKLFEEQLPLASFNSKMRTILLECSALNWGLISPAIFGSMFQSVMNPKERRNLGAHYTSEKNILKLIKPLFLDELKAEFESIKRNKNKLKEFHQKLANLKFLDPACGCGNFLIITYRELRELELDILRVLYNDQLATSIESLIFIDVDQFYGIEYDEFPAKIAEVAMWLMDHQMNLKVSEEFGQYFARLPLKKSAKIVNGNALRIDWNTLTDGVYLDLMASQTNIIHVNEPLVHYDTVNVYSKSVNVTKGSLPPEDKKWDTKNKGKVDYILGNPPFSGKQYQTKEQREDMELVFDGVNGAGVLDYVTAWYLKAAQYIQDTNINVAFVSTNSISQGEQVGLLWQKLMSDYSIKINFAHKTFRWNNEAKGKAAVFVVIIGFATYHSKSKIIYDYNDISGEPYSIKAKQINPYLVDASNIFILRRTKPINDVRKIFKGNQPTEGGFLLLTEDEKNKLTEKYFSINSIIKHVVSGREYLNNIPRFCLWLKDLSPSVIKQYPEVIKRIENVKKMRLESSFAQTRDLANYPTLFRDTKNPKQFIAVPATTSEKRNYIPFGFFDENFIPLNSVYIIPNGTLYNFGVLMSEMHMTWVKYTCGRLKSDYRYSNTLVYNNYPWPKNPSDKNKKRVEEKAQKVLDVRAEFNKSSLADLYNPITMPPKLVKTHHELDKAVDLCYRPQAFTNETSRIEYLFNLYNEYTTPLLKAEIKKRKRK